MFAVGLMRDVYLVPLIYSSCIFAKTTALTDIYCKLVLLLLLLSLSCCYFWFLNRLSCHSYSGWVGFPKEDVWEHLEPVLQARCCFCHQTNVVKVLVTERDSKYCYQREKIAYHSFLI